MEIGRAYRLAWSGKLDGRRVRVFYESDWLYAELRRGQVVGQICERLWEWKRLVSAMVDSRTLAEGAVLAALHTH